MHLSKSKLILILLLVIVVYNSYANTSLATSLGFRTMMTASQDEKSNDTYSVLTLNSSLDFMLKINWLNFHVYYSMPSMYAHLYSYDKEEIINSFAFERTHALGASVGYEVVLYPKNFPISIGYAIGPSYLIYWYGAEYFEHAFSISITGNDNYRPLHDSNHGLGLDSILFINFLNDRNYQLNIAINVAGYYHITGSATNTSQNKTHIIDYFIGTSAISFGIEVGF